MAKYVDASPTAIATVGGYSPMNLLMLPQEFG
jgi:hypothetical protein